jgi:hypothetical protein
MKQRANNLILILIFSTIALGAYYIVSPDEIRVIGWAVVVAVVVLLTGAFSAVMIVNVRVLIPRLLLHNRMGAYALSLAGGVLLYLGIEVGFEWLLIYGYHLTPGEGWYFSGPGFATLSRILSSFTAYSISMFGMSFLFFLRLWRQSGTRMHDLEEQSASGQVEKVRTRIDTETLFAALAQAADRVEQAPGEVSSMLMCLSKSLRTQLYESEHRRPAAALSAPAVPTFNLWSPSLDLLTARRYQLLRHALLVGWFLLIVSFDFGAFGHPIEWVLQLFLLLGLIYFNVYVLVPRWLMRDRIGTYLATVVGLVLVVTLPLFVLYVQENDLNGHTSGWEIVLFAIGCLVKLPMPIFGVSVLLLFRYWVMNERRIVELHTATLLAELEQLQNRVNPHFLFNMLNHIIVLTRTDPARAADTLRKLNDMLHYQFRGFTRQSIRLGDDVDFLTDYLNLEKLRRDRFEFSIDVQEGTEEIALPPLLFIPFVENAVKHGNAGGSLSFVRLRFTREKHGHLCFECVNSKPLRSARADETGGLGLPNIRRRLELLYGERHRLEITENESTFAVRLTLDFKNQKL